MKKPSMARSHFHRPPLLRRGCRIGGLVAAGEVPMWDGTGVGESFIQFENCGADYLEWSWVLRNLLVGSRKAVEASDESRHHSPIACGPDSMWTGQKTPVGRQVSWSTGIFMADSRLGRRSRAYSPESVPGRKPQCICLRVKRRNEERV